MTAPQTDAEYALAQLDRALNELERYRYIAERLAAEWPHGPVKIMHGMLVIPGPVGGRRRWWKRWAR